MTPEERIVQLEKEYNEMDGKYQSLLARYDALANEKDMGIPKMELIRAREQAVFYKRMYDISTKGVEQTEAKVKLGTASEEELIQKLKEQVSKDKDTIAYLKGIVEELMYQGDIDRNVLYHILSDNVDLEVTQQATDEETKRRIRSLRESGMSIRQIANAESVSIGLVHKVIHSQG